MQLNLVLFKNISYLNDANDANSLMCIDQIARLDFFEKLKL